MTDIPLDNRIYSGIHTPLQAVLEQNENDWTLVLRREFPHSPERLWQMLTDPEFLARWSPIVPDRPLTTPGPAICRENPGDPAEDAEVLVADAPERLVHRWGSRLMSWTVTAVSGGAVLELRQTFADRTVAALYAAGWQVCLGRLAADEVGVQQERVVGDRALAYGWSELRDRYESQFAQPQ